MRRTCSSCNQLQTKKRSRSTLLRNYLVITRAATSLVLSLPLSHNRTRCRRSSPRGSGGSGVHPVPHNQLLVGLGRGSGAGSTATRRTKQVTFCHEAGALKWTRAEAHCHGLLAVDSWPRGHRTACKRRHALTFCTTCSYCPEGADERRNIGGGRGRCEEGPTIE